MSTNSTQYWSKKIDKYKSEDWAQKPSLFAQDILNLLPKNGSLLELGCGLGIDGLWFSEKGFNVTQADLEDFREAKVKSLPFITLNMAEPLTTKLNTTFDVVYAHLSLHYFSNERTKELLKELHKLLNTDGIIAFLVNSIHDPEFGEGEKLEDYYFDDGIPKRFFSADSVREFTYDLFEPLLVDEKGTSYKDQAKGLSNLVRFVGRKI